MVGGSLLSFLDLIRQRDSGNQMPQCPCVTLPGSSECIVYEARFLAANVEEAILMFVDMSMDWRIFDERMGGPIVCFWLFNKSFMWEEFKLTGFALKLDFLISILY